VPPRFARKAQDARSGRMTQNPALERQNTPAGIWQATGPPMGVGVLRAMFASLARRFRSAHDQVGRYATSDKLEALREMHRVMALDAHALPRRYIVQERPLPREALM
jgi:hypothetical protein